MRRNGFSIYEINSRVWCREWEARAGASRGLDAVPDDALDVMADRGFDAIWLMGAWTTGAAGRLEALRIDDLRREYDRVLGDWTSVDVIGSPFAITAHTVAESLGGEQALKRFRHRLDARGLGLILDFVPNHTARDHPWVKQHPGWFINVEERHLAERPHDYFVGSPGGPVMAHGRDPHFAGWTDTAQLDCRNREVRAAMLQAITSVAGLCDGVRCDMAMLVLSDVFDGTWSDFPSHGPSAAGEFWADVIEALRRCGREFRFIAEAYWGLERPLAELGFDHIYDKSVYDALRGLDLHALSAAIGDDEQRLQKGLRFLENHDEQRAAAVFPGVRYQASAVAALTLPGARLIHEGQLEGAKVKLPLQLGRRPQEPRDQAICEFYRRLLPVVTSDTLRYGQWRRLSPQPADGSRESSPALNAVLAWQWTRECGEAVVCPINFTEHVVNFTLPLHFSSSAGSARWTDVVAGEDYQFDGQEIVASGLPIKLSAFQAKVLVRR